MKSTELQQLVKKIFSDDKTRAEFLKDPGSVLNRFSLTETEKKAVLSTHDRLGLVTGGSQQLEATIAPTASWLAPAP